MASVVFFVFVVVGGWESVVAVFGVVLMYQSLAIVVIVR